MRRLESLKIAHWLILVVGVCITLLAWEFARRDSSKKVQAEFELRVSQSIDALEKRVHDARLILRGTAGLFSASNEVTRKEFRAYIESLEFNKHYPGVTSVAVSRLVSAKDKAQFVLRAKKESSNNTYDISPDGEREFYAPVLYLEPASEKNAKVMGYDLLSESVRRNAMEAARDSGHSAITDKITLMGNYGTVSQADFLIFAPLYRNESQLETLEQRRANLVGWAHLSFRMDDMVRVMLDDKRDNLHDHIAFQIYAGDSTSVKARVFQNLTTKAQHQISDEPLFTTSKTIVLSNKTFTVLAHSTPELELRINDTRANATLIIGLFASALMALGAWILVSGRERAIQIAKSLSADLIVREKRYRQMFEDSATIAYILDPETGKILDANDVAANFWGYTIEELCNMNIADINLSSLEGITTGMQQQVADGVAGQFYFSHRLKNGETRDVEIYRSVLIDKGKNYIYCIAHDITSRKQAEQALCESQAKLHAIIETAMDAVVQLDSNGNIIDWNTRAEKTFGWLRQDVIGQALIDIIIPQPYQITYLDGMKQFLEDEEGSVRHSQFEIVANHRDKYEFPIEVSITTMIGSSGQSECCVFMHDITNRKKNENALRKARVELENRVFERTAELVRTNRRLNSEVSERTQIQEALEQSQEMLRQLVAHQDRIRETERKRIAREIHDELGQHLLVLRIDVSMLARSENEHPKLGEKIEVILQHIDTTMRSVRAIINNLRPSVLDLGLLAALEWQAEEFQRRSGIVCELVTDDEEMELEDSIATVLFRIMQEALTNVLRHAKASRVQIELHRDLTGLVMTIADNGVGMRYAQRSEQNSFGLVGIRERLYILGGELNIESSSNGTVLTVTLPLAS